MKPEIKLLVQQIRAGKTESEAFAAYCWAKSVTLIDRRNLERVGGDPFKCRGINYHGATMAMAKALDARDEGASDEGIAEAFEAGLVIDFDRDLVFRPMTEEEKPTDADLLRSMSVDEQLKAAKLLGIGNVARAIAGQR